MTWQVVAVAAAIVVATLLFGLAIARWLVRMSERTYSFWPLLVAIAAAFVYAVGIASVVTRLDLA